MEELMQINVLKLFKTAITQLSNKNEFMKQNLIDSDSNLDFELKFLKDELILLNSEIGRFYTKINELNQIQESITKNYINQLEVLVSQPNINLDILTDLEIKMKNCQAQINDVLSEKKKFVCNKFEFINEFLMKSHNIPGMQDEQTSQSEFEYVSNNVSNNYINSDHQSQTVLTECFKMKKQCEVCSLFGEFNQATRSRIDKLSLCKSCAIFHDNHKKILFTEDTLNCSCFYNIGKCANKKLEAFKYLLETIAKFDIQEPCSEPSMVKKRRGVAPKASTNQIHHINSKRFKIETDHL